MKLNSKTVFIIVVAILVIAIIVWPSGDTYTIDSVEDGQTIVLNNGAKVRLIGVTNTKEGKDVLNSLKGEEITLQPDGSANFDPHLLEPNDVVYSYVLLANNGYECINARLLKQGKAKLLEGGALCDSLDNFRIYASKSNGVNPTPLPQEQIDYASENIKLPQYTPQPKRKISYWSDNGDENIAMLDTACDYNLPYTKMFANQLAARHQGEFSIEQACEIFDYCYKHWRYVNDPKGKEYVASASESIAASLTGDCDDFAVLIASCILACGGDACITTAFGSNGGHAYTEVDINSFNGSKDISHIQEVIANRFSSFSPSSLNTRSDGNHIWLNLDWQAAYPGGPYFQAEKKMMYSNVDGQWSFKQL